MMSKISKLTPDKELASMLDGNIIVQTSASSSHAIRAYGANERPNKNLSDEFIDLSWNGGAQSLTGNYSLLRGSLMLSIYVKTQTDGRSKKNIISQIISQCEDIINNIEPKNFYFEFVPTNVIMPTTVNLTNGYSTTILNVSWRVTEQFINN